MPHEYENTIGKDEVASSNLASSSTKKPSNHNGFWVFSFLQETRSNRQMGTIWGPERDFLILCVFYEHIFKRCGGSAVRLLQRMCIDVHGGACLSVAQPA